MKKLFYCLLAVMSISMFTLCFTSCGSDSDEPSTTSGDLIGKWEATSAAYKGTIITFKSDGTGHEYTSAELFEQQLITIYGAEFVKLMKELGTPIEATDDDFIWTKKGNTITITKTTLEGEYLEEKDRIPFDYTINNLTSSKLSLSQFGITCQYNKID